uniref:VPS37 C-terminal domain-containing protein n=1 Tax=Angiostrongylus cantonensis TaxID=6313 RepID=A0A0K0DHV8_ANGCA
MYSGQSAYDSLIDVCLNSAMASVRTLSMEQLNELLYNESRLDSLIDNLPQIRCLPTEREAGLAQNKSLAEWNLAQETKLDQLRVQVRFVAAQEADDDAEGATKAFLSGAISAEQFLKDLLEKKTLAHLRKVKSDRLLTILRDQQYAQAAPSVPQRIVVLSLSPTIVECEHKYQVIFRYDLLNVRIQGYDFTYIEKFQSYIDRMARRFNFNVVESYAVAAQTQRVVVYKPNSTIVDNDINLALYDRVVRLSNVAAPHLQLFITLVETHLPIGVTVTFKQHEKADEDYRYIPDLLLKQKQEELKSLDNPIVRRNLGWE